MEYSVPCNEYVVNIWLKFKNITPNNNYDLTGLMNSGTVRKQTDTQTSTECIALCNLCV